VKTIEELDQYPWSGHRTLISAGKFPAACCASLFAVSC
jgi:hypothetical protein